MKVSVVIPVYNEEQLIVECLGSLQKQTYKDLEIIVVDDGSVDNTPNLIKQFTNHHSLPAIYLLRQQHKGPGAARNLGAKEAKGEILVFVDADMTFAPDFIKKLVDPIIKGKTKGTFSKEEYVSNIDNIWSVCWGLNEGWEKGKRHPANYPDKQKVFRAILKSEFENVGGFDPTGYTDDWTLAEKLGYEAMSAPGSVYYHKNPDTLRDVFKQARWIGKRQYKLGKIGTLVAGLRSSLPISLAVGLVKGVIYQKPQFLPFKIVYDLGVFAGALESLIGGSRAK